MGHLGGDPEGRGPVPPLLVEHDPLDGEEVDHDPGVAVLAGQEEGAGAVLKVSDEAWDGEVSREQHTTVTTTALAVLKFRSNYTTVQSWAELCFCF